MADDPVELARQARDLRALADDVATNLDPARRALEALGADFTGALARDTRDELHEHRSALDAMAEALRAEAARRDARARAAEPGTSSGGGGGSW